MTKSKSRISGGVRIATLLFPPLGLWLLWRTRGVGLFRKLFGTFGVLLYCIPYAALIIFLMVRTNLVQVEWRGGFPPVLTRHKTVPDYSAVESHRARTSSEPVARSTTAPRSSDWTGFRGPHRDGVYAGRAFAPTG